jgi:hypothetical protein
MIIELKKDRVKSASCSLVMDFGTANSKTKNRIVVVLYHSLYTVPISNHINSPRGARAALRKRYMTLREHPDWLVGFELNGAVMPVHEIMQIAQAGTGVDMIKYALAKIFD